MRGALALLAVALISGCAGPDAISSSGTPAAASLSPSPPLPSGTVVLPTQSRPPLAEQPSPSALPEFPPGTCTLPGLPDRQLVDHWIALAGRHDMLAVRDCFTAAYGVPAPIVDRWANEGQASGYLVQTPDGTLIRNCRWFGVSADFPDGNPYAPVQDPTRMFLAVGIGNDGGAPRIFASATAIAIPSPENDPGNGMPYCPAR
jgi:hypothetical protein